jgi:hypothetical protein
MRNLSSYQALQHAGLRHNLFARQQFEMSYEENQRASHIERLKLALTQNYPASS